MRTRHAVSLQSQREFDLCYLIRQQHYSNIPIFQYSKDTRRMEYSNEGGSPEYRNNGILIDL